MTSEDIASLRRLAGYLARHGTVDPMELLQAGAVGFLEAATRYDPAGGAKLSTFCSHRAKWAMLDFIRRRWADPPVDGTDAMVNVATSEAPADEALDARRAIRGLLTSTRDPVERELIAGALRGETQRTMAERLGISKTWASRKLNEAVKRQRK